MSVLMQFLLLIAGGLKKNQKIYMIFKKEMCLCCEGSSTEACFSVQWGPL